jgi:DNA-directed RNA polymerase specialized sigma24 family protein
MTTDQVPTDAELEEFLREEGPEFFLEALYDKPFRLRLARYIKRVSWGTLEPNELADVVQDTLIAVWENVSEPGFDNKAPLRIVYTIARNKAIDLRRRKTRSRSAPDQEAVNKYAAADLSGTRLGLNWKLMDPIERAEFDTALFEIVCGLPKRQRMVAETFFEIFPELRERGKFKPLADALGRRTGKTEDVVSVKSAWQAAREKIKRDLYRKGFRFVEGSEA